MIENLRLIRSFTQKIDKAITPVAAKYEEGLIADEDDFTSQLLGRIESELDNWNPDGIVFRAKKTTWRGRRSEEAKFGADIAATMNVDLRDYKTRKGIFIQAKCLDYGVAFDSTLWEKLKRQIKKMKRHTFDSYVWLYDSSGVRSIKAHAVHSLDTKRPDDLYSTKCATFLGEFLQSKHGDPRIPDVMNLGLVREILPVQHILSFSIFENGWERDRIS